MWTTAVLPFDTDPVGVVHRVIAATVGGCLEPIPKRIGGGRNGGERAAKQLVSYTPAICDAAWLQYF